MLGCGRRRRSIPGELTLFEPPPLCVCDEKMIIDHPTMCGEQKWCAHQSSPARSYIHEVCQFVSASILDPTRSDPAAKEASLAAAAAKYNIQTSCCCCWHNKGRSTDDNDDDDDASSSSSLFALLEEALCCMVGCVLGNHGSDNRLRSDNGFWRLTAAHTHTVVSKIGHSFWFSPSLREKAEGPWN